MAMGVAPSCLLAFLFFLLCCCNAQSSSIPSFIWSNRRFSHPEHHRVEYQISPPHSVAAAAVEQFMFAHKHCSGSSNDCAQVLVTFISNEQVRSEDLSRELTSDTLKELKSMVAGSNVSLAFPYVSTTNGMSVFNELLQSVEEEKDFAAEYRSFGCRVSSRTFLTLDSIEDITSMKEDDTKLLLVCLHEGSTMTSVVTKLEEAGVGYVALFASEAPFWGENAPKHRLLVSINDTSAGNGSSSAATNKTSPYCDEVCQNKATILEAIFVSVVLLIILISGLCCMMGIQAPLRFEKPHES